MAGPPGCRQSGSRRFLVAAATHLFRVARPRANRRVAPEPAIPARPTPPAGPQPAQRPLGEWVIANFPMTLFALGGGVDAFPPPPPNLNDSSPQGTLVIIFGNVVGASMGIRVPFGHKTLPKLLVGFCRHGHFVSAVFVGGYKFTTPGCDLWPPAGLLGAPPPA